MCVCCTQKNANSFGENGNGELGTGTTDDVGLFPADMGDNLLAADVAAVQDVAAGGSTTCALLAGDSVICW